MLLEEQVEAEARSGVARDASTGPDLHWSFRTYLAEDGLSRADQWLAEKLWNEIQRRGLVDQPGNRLGPKFALYTRIARDDDELTSDLLGAAFERAFSSGRLRRYVHDCANPDWNPDIMITTNLKHLVHELQQAGDPGGTALYDGLKRAAQLESVARVVRFDEAQGTLQFRTAEDGALDTRVLLRCFEGEYAVRKLNLKLQERLDGNERTHLRGDEISAELGRGLVAAAREAGGRISVADAVRALRPLLIAERRREDLTPELPTLPGGDSTGLEAFARLGERAFDAVRRAPGLQQRTCEHLLALLGAICTAMDDGRDPQQAVRELGWKKQSLFDRFARLREVLRAHLPLAAALLPNEKGLPTEEDSATQEGLPTEQGLPTEEGPGGMR